VGGRREEGVGPQRVGEEGERGRSGKGGGRREKGAGPQRVRGGGRKVSVRNFFKLFSKT